MPAEITQVADRLNGIYRFVRDIQLQPEDYVPVPNWVRGRRGPGSMAKVISILLTRQFTPGGQQDIGIAADPTGHTVQCRFPRRPADAITLSVRHFDSEGNVVGWDRIQNLSDLHADDRRIVEAFIARYPMPNSVNVTFH